MNNRWFAASNAYCSGQLLHRVIPKTIICGLTGQKLPLQGGGKAEKSYIHARDLGRAIHLVAEKAPLGKIYNAGPAEPTSIKRVVELCAEALGMPFEQLCEMARPRPREIDTGAKTPSTGASTSMVEPSCPRSVRSRLNDPARKVRSPMVNSPCSVRQTM